MKRLFGYLGRYKTESILGPLFKMLEAVFELIVPLIVADMVDVGIASGDTGYILGRGGVLVLLGVVGFASSVTAQYFAAKAAIGCASSMRSDLFKHIASLSYSEFDGAGEATLITRMTSDINGVQSGVNMALRLLLRSPFVVAGAVVMAFTVDATTARVFAAAVPVLCAVVFVILLVSMPLYKKVQQNLDRVTLATRENLSGVRVVRAFGREADEERGFKRDNDLLFRSQTGVGRISALLGPLTYVLVNLAVVAVLKVGGAGVYTGRITTGDVIALLNYMSQILVELVKFANLVILISRSAASMHRVDAVFKLKPSVSTGPDAVTEMAQGAPAVEFKGAGFAYGGSGKTSVRGVSLSVAVGETVGIIGGTGSGKTTLVNLIPRFYDASEGSVLVGGADVKRWDVARLRALVGVVPQRAALFSGTLRDNLRLGCDTADGQLWAALATAQADDFVKAKGEGLELEIEPGGRNLSGGQRQRLTVARALAKGPRILILDDSASALDYATDARLRRAIKRDTAGLTVFIVSQRVSAIRDADRIVVLDEGRPAGIGTHRELLKRCPEYRELCRSQMTEQEVERDERG